MGGPDDVSHALTTAPAARVSAVDGVEKNSLRTRKTSKSNRRECFGMTVDSGDIRQLARKVIACRWRVVSSREDDSAAACQLVPI